MMNFIESSAGRIAARIQNIGVSFDPEVLSLPGGSAIAVFLWLYASAMVTLKRAASHERLEHRDRTGVRGGFRLCESVLSPEQCALHVEQNEKIDAAFAILNLGQLLGSARGLSLFEHAGESRFLRAVADARIFEVFRARLGLDFKLLGDDLVYVSF